MTIQIAIFQGFTVTFPSDVSTARAVYPPYETLPYLLWKPKSDHYSLSLLPPLKAVTFPSGFFLLFTRVLSLLLHSYAPIPLV